MSPQTHSMREHAALIPLQVWWRTSMLTEWFVQICLGWEGKAAMAGVGWAGAGRGAQLSALPNSSLTPAPE